MFYAFRQFPQKHKKPPIGGFYTSIFLPGHVHLLQQTDTNIKTLSSV